MSVSTYGSLESSSWFVGKMERVNAEQFLMEVRSWFSTYVYNRSGHGLLYWEVIVG